MASKISGPKLVEPFEKFVERTLIQIKAAWPKLADQSIGLYAAFIREQSNKHGRTAIEKLIREAINHKADLPSISELKAYLPVQRYKTSTDQNCSDCEGSGWMRVFDGKTMGGQPIDQKLGAVRRCHCWRKETA